MRRKIPEDNYQSQARASPRGEVCLSACGHAQAGRKPATIGRGEAHERHSRLIALGRAGTTPQSPVNRGSGSRARLGRNPSRAYPGRAPSRPGQGRATAMDCARAQAALTPTEPSAEGRVVLGRLPGRRAKDRTGRTRRREDHLDQARR